MPVINKGYDVVRAVVKGHIHCDKNNYVSEMSLSKIGPDWVEFNNSTYERFKLNPATGRLEQYIEKYGATEWVQESLEELKAAHQEQKTFRVGDGVRFGYGSDCYPGTVIEVHPRYIVVQDDEAIPYHRDIHAEEQEWDFVRNPNGATRKFYKKKDGYYAPKGTRSGMIYKGRHKHYDIHF